MDPAAKVTYESIPAELLSLLEDAVLCRRPDAADRLIEGAAKFNDSNVAVETESVTAVDGNVDDRLVAALTSGDDRRLEQDLTEAVELHGSANAVVEGPLMKGMEHVGTLFESGKMFLPQVVKSAGTMHKAVKILRPLLEENKSEGRGKGSFLIATVRGDVHDIGKNIAAVVLRCNNFDVIDLGVQVEPVVILDAVKKYRPDFIGLSGLISPSLEEMVRVASMLRDNGISTPIFVGGAATSEVHTALRIAPVYGSGVVVRVADASQNPIIASRILANGEEEIRCIKERQQIIRDREERREPVSSAPVVAPEFNRSDDLPVKPSFIGQHDVDEVDVAEVSPFINWIYFYNCWKVKPDSAAAADLLRDAERLLGELSVEGATMRCKVAFYPAVSEGDNIVVGDTIINTPRQRPSAHRTQHLALSDFISHEGDYIGCFIVTIGQKLRDMLSEGEGDGNSYRSLLLQSLCDRLAEATSEWLHYRVRTRLWGYAPDEPYDIEAICHGKYQGIRPAVGYPSLPDQRLMHTLTKLISPESVGVTVTPNGALSPASSIAGFYIGSKHSRYFTI
ncbi:MAG: B12-binding domain-containing protein [Muribaculaceae bacterium]|nr:B12-binding domain-containing protein [Muribaculaceae bacterium]